MKHLQKEKLRTLILIGKTFRFIQFPSLHVVGSHSKSPIVPPSSVGVEVVSLAEHPVYSPAVIAAWAAMNAPGGGNAPVGGNAPAGGGQNCNGMLRIKGKMPSNRCLKVEPGGNGNGQGGNENGQDGGAQAPLAYNNAAQFLAAWNASPSDQARDNLEQEAINRSPAQDVQFAAMLKINLRLQAVVGQLTNQVNTAQGQVAAANVSARQAQAAAQGGANVDRFRPAAPPKYGDKKKGEHVGQWLRVIEDCLRTALDADYIWLASSYLEGGPRSLWTKVYEAYKAANHGGEPSNPRQFFRETLEANYGLQDLDQKYRDTWNSLKMGPNQGITEYNVEFQQAFTDLAGHVTDEQVKIEKYRARLQHNLRELCRTSPARTRWARLNDLVQYASLQWPVVQERIAKRKKSPTEPAMVGGKCKASGGGASGSSRSSSKPKLGASGGLSDEQFKKDMAEKLCHKCHKPGHQAKNCPPSKKGKVAAASGPCTEDDMSEEGDFQKL
jgi:hypothetical protein